MVRAVFNSWVRASRSKQDTILTAASTIALIYGVSALLGFIRNRMLSGYFGDSVELGLYFASDDIPTITFSLIVSGALSSSFIPIFNKHFKKDPEDSWRLTSSVINFSVLLFSLLFILIAIFAEPLVANVLARNSDLSPEHLTLYANLLRILMLAQFGFIISSFYTSILQSFNHFLIPALAPVMLNLGVIISLFLFYGVFGIYAAAWGTVLGSILHMVVQLPLVKTVGFKFSWLMNLKSKGLRDIYRLMVPRALGQTAQKLIIPLYTNLALYISAPSNVILTFADDLQSLPVRIFGVSIGQAALPMFASAYDEKSPHKFKVLLTKTLYQVIFFIMPISVLVFILRVPLVRLAYGAKKYSWDATVMTAYTLAFFSLSLITQALMIIVARGFYTLYDTKTPFKIGIGTIVLNAILAVVFVKQLGLGVWSLALAFSISSLVATVVLFINLMKKIDGIDYYDFFHKINRIIIASFLMGGMLYIPLKVFDKFVFDTTRTIDLIILTFVVTLIGVGTYVYIVRLFRIKELDYTYILFQDVRTLFKKKTTKLLKDI